MRRVARSGERRARWDARRKRSAAQMIDDCFRHQYPEAFGGQAVPDMTDRDKYNNGLICSDEDLRHLRGHYAPEARFARELPELPARKRGMRRDFVDFYEGGTIIDDLGNPARRSR